MSEAIKLKRKYTFRSEPEKAKNRSGFKNSPQWGGGSSGGHGKGRTKKIIKGNGFSGKTIGNMLRSMSNVQEKRSTGKKK